MARSVVSGATPAAGIGMYLPAIDAYIAKQAEFAQPILTHVRELMHKAVPDVEEAMKWGRPFFLYKGVILGNVAAFKEHCSVGLWGDEITAVLRKDGLTSSEAMGTFGRLTSVSELPLDKRLLVYIRQAAAFVGDGTRTKSISRVRVAAKPELETPAELVEALGRDNAAKMQFEAFAPSHRREYVEWIADAKRDETRAKRVAQTVEWLAEGKRRNWKYENC